MKLTFSLLLLAMPLGQAQDLDNTCGDCWCVPELGSDCPEVPEEGINARFPQIAADIYSTYQPMNCLALETSDGSDECYPFADSVGPQGDNYPSSSFPQCTIYNDEDEAYCAYVFEEDGNGPFTSLEECTSGRKYKMMTFGTVEEIPSNGVLTHEGACGVCSTAQDLSVRFNKRDQLQTIGVLCGTQYFVGGQRFDTLVECYTEQGFTKECATLWGHFTATNAALCASFCLGHEAPFNGDPPECELTDCLQCGGNFSAVFDDIAGRNQQRSGITENIGRPCNEFYPVVHDPCPGVTLDETMTLPSTAVANATVGVSCADESSSPAEPTQTPTSSSSTIFYAISLISVLVLFF